MSWCEISFGAAAKKTEWHASKKKCTVIRLNSPLSDSALITDPYSARRDNCDHPLVSATMTKRLKEQKKKSWWGISWRGYVPEIFTVVVGVILSSPLLRLHRVIKVRGGGRNSRTGSPLFLCSALLSPSFVWREKTERPLLTVSGRAINISDTARSHTTWTQRSRTLWEWRCDARRQEVHKFLLRWSAQWVEH